MRLKKTTSGWPSFWLFGENPPLWARVLSSLYCGIIRLRKWCYQQQHCKSHRVNRPVLVIGNRVVGGTGKTPTILGLVTRLKARNISVGIVSRGYGRKGKNAHLVQHQDSIEQAGDEPLLLFKELSVPVVVAAQRVSAINLLLQYYPNIDLIISDDGWQHFAMARDAVVEIIDHEKGYGNGYCLPAGPLRDTIDNSTADLVIYQGIDLQLEPAEWYHIATQTYYPLSEKLSYFTDNNLSISALAGIGHPERFFNTLKNIGINISSSFALADHQPLPENLLIHQQPSAPIIMTMKDAMRCPTHLATHCWALVVKTKFTPEAEEKLLKLVLHTIQTHSTELPIYTQSESI